MTYRESYREDERYKGTIMGPPTELFYTSSVDPTRKDADVVALTIDQIHGAYFVSQIHVLTPKGTYSFGRETPQHGEANVTAMRPQDIKKQGFTLREISKDHPAIKGLPEKFELMND